MSHKLFARCYSVSCCDKRHQSYAFTSFKKGEISANRDNVDGGGRSEEFGIVSSLSSGWWWDSFVDFARLPFRRFVTLLTHIVELWMSINLPTIKLLGIKEWKAKNLSPSPHSLLPRRGNRFPCAIERRKMTMKSDRMKWNGNQMRHTKHC